MTPNRSVMQARASAPDELDYFPTPPFATRALREFLIDIGHDLRGMTAWEPACGECHMSGALWGYFGDVRASDVHRYSDEHELIDFLTVGRTYDPVDWVITNPPFGGMEEDGIETNFPAAFRTRETADLFMVLIMHLLKDGGRAAVVLPDGFLFGEGIEQIHHALNHLDRCFTNFTSTFGGFDDFAIAHGVYCSHSQANCIL